MCFSFVEVGVRDEREETATSRSFGLVLQMHPTISKLCHLAREGTLMKFNLPITMTAALTFVLAGTAPAQQQVRTDHDRSANFEQYKTYSWQKIGARDPLMVDRIKSAVDSALAAKGWAQVPSGGDTAIVAVVTTQTQETGH
jgi:hypothetical protein